MITVDALVLGAGPAAAAAAIALRGAGRSVLLVERARRAGTSACEHLPGEVRPLLDRLDLDARSVAATGTPCHAVAAAWETPTLGERSAVRDPFGAGWLLDRARFDALLTGEAVRRGAIHWRANDAAQVERSDGEFHLRLGARAAIAPLLVDARGRNAPPLAATGARRVRRDRLLGVVLRVAPRTRPAPVLLVEAAERGWWYSAPFPDGTLAAAWLTDPDLLAADGGAEAAFALHLARSLHVAARVRDAPACAPPRILCAASSALEPAAGPGWAAVGDAAAAHDPLAARGVAHALASGVAAADALCAGDPNFAARAAARFTRYLDERAATYRRVRRFATAPFWQRRA